MFGALWCCVGDWCISWVKTTIFHVSWIVNWILLLWVEDNCCIVFGLKLHDTRSEISIDTAMWIKLQWCWHWLHDTKELRPPFKRVATSIWRAPPHLESFGLHHPNKTAIQRNCVFNVWISLSFGIDITAFKWSLNEWRFCSVHWRTVIDLLRVIDIVVKLEEGDRDLDLHLYSFFFFSYYFSC